MDAYTQALSLAADLTRQAQERATEARKLAAQGERDKAHRQLGVSEGLCMAVVEIRKIADGQP